MINEKLVRRQKKSSLISLMNFMDKDSIDSWRDEGVDVPSDTKVEDSISVEINNKVKNYFENIFTKQSDIEWFFFLERINCVPDAFIGLTRDEIRSHPFVLRIVGSDAKKNKAIVNEKGKLCVPVYFVDYQYLKVARKLDMIRNSVTEDDLIYGAGLKYFTEKWNMLAEKYC